jgi:cytochrome c oxidase assembly factor CtaG
MWLFLIGLFCFLLVLGALFGKHPLTFAASGLVILGALCFIGFIGIIIWALVNAH